VDGQLGHNAFLIEWEDGRTFMIDAAMDRAQAEEFAALLKSLGRGEDQAIYGTLPELMGSAVSRVTGVGFTHLHIDHTQGVVPFCAARGAGASLFQTDLQRDKQNYNTDEGAQLLEDSCLAKGKIAGDMVHTVEGFPGLGMISVGGHTPGSTIFVAAVDGHLWVFAGDTTNSKANLLSNTGKGFLYSTFFVPENTDRLETLRLWLASLDSQDDTTVIVSHDINDIKASGLAAFGTEQPE
jgi:glyoxylase-like metal-dependent hydrolase (beta-lactamase superfamily II)